MFLFSLPTLAQRETANWYFGNNAGLNFNHGVPEILLDGSLSTIEGCSTISDSAGNLIFYTNGKTVWNRNHNIMSNGQGLLGHESSSQSAIIIPNIVNPNLFYIFTADVSQAYFNVGTGNGLNYSIVDLSLDGGLGALTSKNINLLAQSSEKVSAVSAFNGSGFWVVTQTGNKFYSYKVDGNGVSAIPAISIIGPNISNFENIRGCLKISPNGEKIAIAHAFLAPLGGSINLYDFNVTTGIVSNEEIISTEKVFYGVEFSSNSKKLYASARLIDKKSEFPIAANIVLYQYDLESPNIESTEYLLNVYTDYLPIDLAGTLQIAFDKKIYHSITSDKLSVIREPNLPQVSCDYREYNVDLGGRLTRFGLPSYIQSSFESIVDIENLCFNNATQFNLDANDVIQSVNWDFGDPTSGADNTSSLINPIHTFSQTGIYAVTITVNFLNRETQTYIEFVEINELPIVLNNITLTQCDVDENDDGITLFNLTEAKELFDQGNEDIIVTYFKNLQDVQTNENALDENEYQNEFINQIIFAKVFENVECYSVTEITLNVLPFSDLGTYSTTFICDPNNVNVGDTTLNLEEVNAQLLQDFPNTDITFYDSELNALLENQELLDELTFSNSQTAHELFFRIETFNGCNNIGKLEIKVVFKPEVEDLITVFCPSNENILDAGNGFSRYLWSTGETTQKIQIDQEGVYWVEVSHGADCTDIINVDAVLSEKIEIKDIVINDFRSENSVKIVLQSFNGNLKYSLDGGQTFITDNEFNNVAPGLYNLVVIRDDCNTISETILVGGYPNYFTPNGDGIHDGWQMYKPELFQNAKIKIYDRFGKLLKTMEAFESWDGIFNGKLVTPTDYWFSINQNNKIVYGHFALKL